MSNRPLFATRKNRHIWLWRGATLLAGAGVLSVVVAKVSAPVDPAADKRIDQEIAASIEQGGDAHTIPLTIEHKDAASPAMSDAGLPPKPIASITKPAGMPLSQIGHAPKPASDVEAASNSDHTTAEDASSKFTLRKVTVKKGDSLSTLFERAGLGYSDVHRVMKLGDTVNTLKTLHPGEQITFKLTPDGQGFQGLSYDLTPSKTLDIHFGQGDKLIADEETIPLQTRQHTVSGTIESSLYQSAIEAGAPPSMVMQLAEIFGWKVNFLKEVQDGDRFTLIYEDKYKDGKRVDTGHVVAAEFTNNGKTYQALRYTTPNGTTGYYEPDGKNLERGFLRYPVKFSRISSRFNLHRMHPIYHRIRAHKGVDFAAPTGTPIHASGNGTIKFIGWQHGYGKVIKIKHDSRYESVYGHMSRFNKSLKRGTHVNKGEVIGYVGMTGAATGPHLHYEFHVNGKYKNPLKVALPEAHPIPSKYRADFLAQTQSLVNRLAANDRNRNSQTASLTRN